MYNFITDHVVPTSTFSLELHRLSTKNPLNHDKSIDHKYTYVDVLTTEENQGLVPCQYCSFLLVFTIIMLRKPQKNRN